MDVNFISPNHTGEIRTFYVNSDNEEIRSGNETNEIMTKLLKSFLNNYQNKEKILRNGSNFVFESTDLLSYHIHKINLKREKSYIKFPEWILNKRATINPKNKDNKCFQYAVTVALNHQFHSFRTHNTLKKHERLCNNHDYCHIEMSTNDNNTLKYNHREKSLKAPWVIYADFEFLQIKQ